MFSLISKGNLYSNKKKKKKDYKLYKKRFRKKLLLLASFPAKVIVSNTVGKFMIFYHMKFSVL